MSAALASPCSSLSPSSSRGSSQASSISFTSSPARAASCCASARDTSAARGCWAASAASSPAARRTAAWAHLPQLAPGAQPSSSAPSGVTLTAAGAPRHCTHSGTAQSAARTAHSSCGSASGRPKPCDGLSAAAGAARPDGASAEAAPCDGAPEAVALTPRRRPPASGCPTTTSKGPAGNRRRPITGAPGAPAAQPAPNTSSRRADGPIMLPSSKRGPAGEA
mmetsp:Transcript_24004/g.90663  ORF Transcript_24004/g.90663 Transcript_24004/m.90663 type:complete len:222 (-) Transcript_24004:895-1560(-)